MRVDFRTFNSRFARRLFFFLFLAMSVPVAVLATVTVLQISGHLSAQHGERLHRDAKHLGMTTFERLERIASELAAAAQAEQRFVRLEHAAWYRRSTTESGTDEAVLSWLRPGTAELQSWDAAITAAVPETTPAFTLAAVPVDSQRALVAFVRNATGVFAAPVDPAFLWSAEELPADQFICIVNGSSEDLFCNKPGGTALVAAFEDQEQRPASGLFRWVLDDQDMRAVHWELFLQTLGMGEAWTVLVSEAERDFFEPIVRFRTTLIIVVLASMLAALMLSIGHIRRVLQPLQTLRNATRQVGAGRLDQVAKVSSGDEFEELADSFNQMVGKLAGQFEQLETLAGIDQLILSSMDPEAVVAEVTECIRELLDCELLVVATEQRGERSVILSGRGMPQLRLALQEHQSLNITEQPPRTISTLTGRPTWLPADIASHVECFSFVPLRSGEVLDLVLVGWAHAPARPDDTILQMAGRVSVALSRARWQAKLHHQAHFDELTGLPNRVAFKQGLEQALARADRDGGRLAVLFVDMDRFKFINDSLGHGAGDEYLREVAERIRQCARPTDIVARLGGDEFTIAIIDVGAHEDLTYVVMDLVRKLMERVPQPVDIGLHQLRSTLSVGIAVYPQDGRSLDDLMKQADTAMYQTKRHGGNGYHFYALDMHVEAQQRMELESEMRHALEVNEFVLYYQPQVCVRTGEVVGAEVLLRWMHRHQGMVSPGVFIPIAEESLLIVDIDRWVLRSACRQLRTWLDAGLQPRRLSINVSAAQFQQRDFVPFVTDVLREYHLAASSIELEITEGALIHDLSYALESLQALRDAGIHLAIDDFGTGYCSLAYLKSMPIHKLKIDQSFVRDITGSSRDAAIVEVILQLSHQLELTCVAEGVETEQEAAWLAEKGCDTFQGYLFYRPMPLESFQLLLLQQSEPDSARTS